MTKSEIKELNKTIGKRVKDRREFMDFYKMGVFADIVGIDHETLSKSENGKRSFKAHELIKIAEALDCSVDFLVGVVDAPTTDITVKQIHEYTGLSDSLIELLHVCCVPLPNEEIREKRLEADGSLGVIASWKKQWPNITHEQISRLNAAICEAARGGFWPHIPKTISLLATSSTVEARDASIIEAVAAYLYADPKGDSVTVEQKDGTYYEWSTESVIDAMLERITYKLQALRARMGGKESAADMGNDNSLFPMKKIVIPKPSKP
ncbi:MAG: helix-turn-helix domain-containing protein [Dehalococcoidia bacterium]|nr:helix-turn-helix domain-containing protein [Dehalococcoidia bacterium]